MDELSHLDVQCALQVWNDVSLVDPRIQISGVCFIFDFSNLRKESLLKMHEPKYGKMLLRYYQVRLISISTPLNWFALIWHFHALSGVFTASNKKTDILQYTADLRVYIQVLLWVATWEDKIEGESPRLVWMLPFYDLVYICVVVVFCSCRSWYSMTTWAPPSMRSLD